MGLKFAADDGDGGIGAWRSRVLAWRISGLSWSNRGPIAMLHACDHERAAYLIPIHEAFRVAFSAFSLAELLD
jgi:hypothetical protein